MENQFLQVWLTAAVVGGAAALAADIYGRRMARSGRVSRAAVDLGGLALLMALAAALWPLADTHHLLAPLVAGGAFVWLASALTDSFRPFRGLRFLAAAAVGAWLWTQGLYIASVKLPWSTVFVSLGTAGLLVTVLWLGLFGALFARAATIPRVSWGIGFLSAATFFAVCRLQPLVTGDIAAVVALAVCGACLGPFLLPERLAYKNATAGGYVLGFFIGAATILGALKHTAFLVALLPLMIVGVPLFAAVYGWVADFVRGRRRHFWRAHHPHVHEILLAQGYGERQIAAVLLTGSALLGALGLVLVVIIEWSFIAKALIVLISLAVMLLMLYLLLRLMKPARAVRHEPDEIRLLGIRVHRVNMAEAMERVAGFIEKGSPHVIVTSDATGFMRAHDDPELMEIVNGADLVTADGAGVVLASRILNMPIDVRVAGCDMVGEICKVAARMGRPVYLLGAAPGVAEKAAQNLAQQAPGLLVAGCRDGYFKPAEEEQVVAEIAALKPAVLFVALGIPRQELFIKKYKDRIGAAVYIGIGGSFDVISGMKKRAPLWMQRTGLEWLYRVAKEPFRIPRLVALPRIVLMSFRELLRPPADSPDSADQ